MKGAIDPPVIVEQHFEVPADIVWQAITEREQMVQWYFENIEAFEPQIGFETRFVIENEGRIFIHLWRIVEVEPFKKISYNWKYEGYAGDSTVTFKVMEEEKGCRLHLTHQVLNNFPPNIPEFTRDSCLGGWNYFIQNRLREFLIDPMKQ